MVQKYQSPMRVYKHPFEFVMRAYQMRFPTCDLTPMVQETKVLDDTVDEISGIHIINRRIKVEVKAPKILKKAAKIEYLVFRQRNTLDPANRTLRIDIWNESFHNRIKIQELCLYTVHPENPEWTCYEQNADLDIKSFFGIEGKAEKFAIKEYLASIDNAKDVMEYHIKVLSEEEN